MNRMLGPQCYTCRKRQVKCDSNTPVCLRCQKDGRNCRGYERPLKIIVYRPPGDTQLQQSSRSTCGRKRKDELSRISRFNRETAGCVGSKQRQYDDLSQSGREGEVREGLERMFPSKPKYKVSSAFFLWKSPHNKLRSLNSTLVKAIQPTTDFRFNLAWAYGDFFQLLPQRIGINSALDSALETLLSAHSDICLGYRSTQTRTMILHTRALRILRLCLNDPRTAQTTETLGAVLVLLTLQGMVGSQGDYWSQHYVGASQILKARKFAYNCNDEFESKLLENLRSLVVMEGIVSGRLDFTREEWQCLMTPRLSEGAPSEALLQIISSIPDILRQRRQLGDFELEQGLLFETRQHYEALKRILHEHRSSLVHIRNVSNIKAVQGLAGVPFGPIVQRMYAMCIFFAITLNLVLQSFQIQDEAVFSEGEEFAEEIVTIAQESLQYRPFGSSHMILCLMAGYDATRDQSKQSRIVDTHKVYAQDFPWATNPSNESGMHSFKDGLRLSGIVMV